MSVMNKWGFAIVLDFDTVYVFDLCFSANILVSTSNMWSWKDPIMKVEYFEWK